jgi:hypothetical protein
MRTKAIIDGFKNSQKFRFILLTESGAEFGMVITIQQMSDQFATRDARVAVWSAMAKLSFDRQLAQARGETLPIGLVRDAQGFRQVQVDLY